MPNSVDEKIVQLTLDNKQFNKASDESIDSLDKLKKALQFEGATDALNDIDKSVKKVDFNPLNNGIQMVSNQFNALNTVADAALRNITNRAIDAGTNLVKSLSIDQITAGFTKFEQKTTSVATLLAQGFNIDTINEQLDRLNWFTDETSYNFTDMVDNIAKFTASGKGLEESTTALEGIALWAALSGQNATTASHAMYQLSQAMGAGVMRKEDYKSIQNVSMDTQEFRQHAIDAAIALGTLRETSDGMYQSLVGKDDVWGINQFAENLTEGAWFTSDVMMKVFKDYSGTVDQIYEYAEEKGLTASEAIAELEGKIDTFGLKAFRAGQEARTFGDAIDSVKDAVSTGWMNTFQAIIGNSEQATQVFTDLANGLYDIFAESGNARNEMLAEWNDLGGRDILFDGIYKACEALVTILNTVKEAFREVFPEMTADRLLDLTFGFRDLVSYLTPTEASLQNLKDILKVFFNTIKSVLTVVKTVATALSPIAALINRIAGTVLQLVGNLARLVNIGLENIFTEERMQGLYTIVNNIAKVILMIGQIGIAGIVTAINNIVNAVNNIWNAIQGNGGGIQGVIETAKQALESFWQSFNNGESTVNKVINVVLTIIGGAVATIVGLGKTLWDVLTGKDVDLEANFGPVAQIFAKISDAIKTADVPGKLQPVIEVVKTFISWLGSFFEELTNADSGIRQIFSVLKNELIGFWNWMKESLSDLTVEDIESIALVAALIKIGLEFVNIEKAVSGMVKSVGGTFESLSSLVDNFNAEKFGGGGFLNTLSEITENTKWLQIGIGITAMIAALTQLAKLPQEDIVNAVIVMGLAVAGLLAVMKQMEKMNEASAGSEGGGKGKSTNAATAILEISASIFIIVQAMKQIQGMMGDVNALIGAEVVLATLMLGLVGVAKLMSMIDNNKGMIAGAAAVGIMAVAINALIPPIQALAALKPEQVIQGVLGVVGALVGLAGAAALIGLADWSSLLAAIPLIATFTAALVALSAVVLALSAAQTDLGPGLEAVVVLMATLAVSITAMGALLSAFQANIGVMAGAAVAILSFGAAITAISVSILMLQNCDMNTVGTLLLFLTGAISAFIAVAGVAGYLAGPGLLAVAAALLSVGAAAALFANAVLTITQAVAVITGLIVGLGLAANQFGDEFPDMIQQGVDALIEILGSILDAVPDLTFRIAKAITALIIAIKMGIINGLPDIVEGIMAVATAVLNVIAGLTEPLAKALIAAIDALTEWVPDVLASLSHFIDALFAGLVDLLWDAVVSLIDNTFGKAIEKIADVLDPSGQWGDSFRAGIQSWHSEAYKAGEKISDQFAKGVDDNVDEFKDAMSNAGDAAKDGFEESQDPDVPFDYYRYSVDDMSAMFNTGVVNNLGNFASGGAAMGNAAGSSFYNSGMDWMTALQEQFASMDFGSYGTDLFKGVSDEGSKEFQKLMDKITETGSTAYSILWDTGEYTKSLIQELYRGDYIDEMQKARLLGKLKYSEKDKEELNEDYAKTGEVAGTNFMDGVGSGISKGSGGGSKAVKEAKSAAKTISEVFSDEIEKLSRNEELSDKLFRLWKAQNPDATELEMTAKEIEHKSEQVQIATQKAAISQEIYKQTLEAMGESAEETHDAYMQMLDDQIEMLELQNELAELQKGGAESTADAFRAWGDAMQGMYYDRDKDSGRTVAEFLAGCGFSQQEIAESAARQAGYAIPEGLNQAAKEIDIQAEQIGKNASAALVNGLGESIAENEAGITNAGENFMDIFANGALNHAKDMNVDIAGALLDNFAMTHGTEVDNSEAYAFIDNFANGALNHAKEIDVPIGDALMENIKESMTGTENGGFIQQHAKDFVNEFSSTINTEVQNAELTVGPTLISKINESISTAEAEGNGVLGTTFGFVLTHGAALGVTNATEAITENGRQCMNVLAAGFTENAQTLTATIGDTITTAIDPLNEEGAYLNIVEAGKNVPLGLVEGVKDEDSNIQLGTAIQELAQKILDDFYQAIGGGAGVPAQVFYAVGWSIDAGIAEGITTNGGIVKAAAVQVAMDAYQAACQALGIASPSKVMEEVGMFYDLGLVKGIDKYAYRVMDSAKGMTSNLADNIENELSHSIATDYLKDAFGLDDDVHISVVVDVDSTNADRKMSELERAYSIANTIASPEISGGSTTTNISGRATPSSDRIEGILGQIASIEAYQATQMQYIYDQILANNALQQEAALVTSQPQQTTPQVINNYTQNITSPKPVSRLDVYRDTKKLISATTAGSKVSGTWGLKTNSLFR